MRPGAALGVEMQLGSKLVRGNAFPTVVGSESRRRGAIFSAVVGSSSGGADTGAWIIGSVSRDVFFTFAM